MTRLDKDLNDHIRKKIKKFRGNMSDLESAIGCFFVGREMGWKVMLLVHDRKTIKKYEELLDLDFRKELPAVGKLADKSLAWSLVQKVSSFWKAVKGEIAGIKTPEMR